jgi:hypothetical protein
MPGRSSADCKFDRFRLQPLRNAFAGTASRLKGIGGDDGPGEVGVADLDEQGLELR